MQSITVQGASVFCLINGKLFGRVTGFSFNSETQRKPLYTIDTLDPHDLMPGTTRITGKIDLVRTKSDGGLEGSGIVAPYAFLANEKFVTIMLLSREANPYQSATYKQNTRTVNMVVRGDTYTDIQAFEVPDGITSSPATGNRTVIFRTDNAQVTSQSWQVAARGLMTGSFTFEALTWSNEVENAF